MSTEINVISRTQQIVVDRASKSIAVINAGPPGPSNGPAGAPGVVQQVIAGNGIAVDSSTPALPIITAKQVFSTGIRQTGLGSSPAGGVSWPTTPYDVGDHLPVNAYYTTAAGAILPGMYGIHIAFWANTSDPGYLSMNIGYPSGPHPQTCQFAFAALTMYTEDYLNVGNHVTWQIYKPAGMVAFTGCTVRLNLTYRPVNA